MAPAGGCHCERSEAIPAGGVCIFAEIASLRSQDAETPLPLWEGLGEGCMHAMTAVLRTPPPGLGPLGGPRPEGVSFPPRIAVSFTPGQPAGRWQLAMTASSTA